MATKNNDTKFVPLYTDDTATASVYNPLRYLTESQIYMMLDAARSGRISQLQLLFNIVESSDLTLSMCITRRQSALPDWTIKRRDTRRYRSFDEKLAQEQESFLYDQFVRAEDSGTLLKAIDNLHMGVFRGLGVVEPVYDKWGLVKVVPLDPWNFAIDFSCHDELGNYPLYWNPQATDMIDFRTGLKRIPSDQVVVNYAPAPIDSFGLQIYLATHMGWESYCKLIARKGLPATFIIAPEDLPSENLNTWATKAVECTKGGSGAFPYGSNIITQNIDPNNGKSIQDFLEYMAKQIVLASTGGTLTSLAQATGLGSNIADVQQDVFKTIVRHDAYKIGDLINRGIAKKLLDWAYPDRPHLVYFDLSDEAKGSPDKYLADAVTAKSAGLSIDINQLQELTGYTLTQDAPKVDTSIWNVPNTTTPVDKNEKAAWAQEVTQEGNLVVDNTGDDIATQEADEAARETITTPDTDEVKHGVEILKAFDVVLEPLRVLFERLTHAQTKEESDGIVAEINTTIESIETSDDSELVNAVTQLMTDEFEKQTETEKE